jgi:hypothetical protein
MFERTAQRLALAGEATVFYPPKNDETNPIMPSQAPGRKLNQNLQNAVTPSGIKSFRSPTNQKPVPAGSLDF